MRGRPSATPLLVDEGHFRVRAAITDHRIPCLAFAIDEPTHLNVDGDAPRPERASRRAAGSPQLKDAIRAGAPDATRARACTRAIAATSRLRVGELRELVRVDRGAEVRLHRRHALLSREPGGAPAGHAQRRRPVLRVALPRRGPRSGGDALPPDRRRGGDDRAGWRARGASRSSTTRPATRGAATCSARRRRRPFAAARTRRSCAELDALVS